MGTRPIGLEDLHVRLTALEGAPPPASGFAPAYKGTDAVGASTEAIAANRGLYKKFTLAAAAVVLSVEVRLFVGLQFIWEVHSGILLDNAGNPDAVLCASRARVNLANNSEQWYRSPMGLWLAAGDYWAVFSGAQAFSVRYAAGGTDRAADLGDHYIKDGSLAAVPTDQGKTYSIRILTIPSS